MPPQSTTYQQVPKRVPMNEGDQDIEHRRNDTCHGLLRGSQSPRSNRSCTQYNSSLFFSPLSSALSFSRLDAVVTPRVLSGFQLIAPMVCVQVMASRQVNFDGSLDRGAYEVVMFAL